MGNQWQRWEGQRATWRAHRSFVPKVRLRRRSVGHGWTGAAAVIGVALAVGLGAGWWLAGDDASGWSTAPIEWNEVQAVPSARHDADDAAWMKRGLEEVAGGDAAGAGAAVRASFGLCHSGGGTNCVVDGDTIWIGGQNVRLADIDAPETHDPRCAAELALGNRATRRLHALVNSGAVTLTSIERDHDRYGRKLRIVAVGGASVGDTLVGEGLARWYAGGRRSWCG